MTLLFATVASAQTHPVHATIDASKTGPPISKYIYGQFLEHGGNIVNEGVWAEMLADRKFYYAVSSKPRRNLVGSGKGATLRRFDLSVALRFL